MEQSHWKIKNSNIGRISPSALCLLSLVLSVGGFIHFDYIWLFSLRWAIWTIAASEFYILQLGQRETGRNKWEGKGTDSFPKCEIEKFQISAGLDQSTNKTSQLASGGGDTILAQSGGLCMQRGQVYTEGGIIVNWTATPRDASYLPPRSCGPVWKLIVVPWCFSSCWWK